MLTERFRLQYPWPKGPTAASPCLVDIGGGGRFLADRLIDRRPNPTLLEIGSFLGGSTLRWLKVSPSVEIGALDPWPGAQLAGDDYRWEPERGDSVRHVLHTWVLVPAAGTN